MTIRRHHYERAFEQYLRTRRIPYVAVNEAKKALVPPGVRLSLDEGDGSRSLKSFDFTIYGESVNLLVEVKGRKVDARGRGGAGGRGGVGRDAEGMLFPRPRTGRLDNWVTLEDVESLRAWQRLFGAGFEAAFVFLFWCEDQPPDGLFQEIFEHGGRWYAVRSITLGRYAGGMKPRSKRWGTVHLPARAFERLSHPFVEPDLVAGSPLGAAGAMDRLGGLTS